MKRYLLYIALLFINNSVWSQNAFDSFLGTNGIFKTLVPKTINANNNLSFDLKVTVQSTAVKGSKKTTTTVMYLNSKDGYVGINQSSNSALNENDTSLDFVVETLNKQSFRYSNQAGAKKVEKLESNLINTFKNIPLKKIDASVAKPKKYLKNTLTATPYFVDTSGLQKKYTRYCYGLENSLEGNFKSYLGSFGVGFYNVNNQTILCIATEHPFMNIEITKIEKVKIVFDTSKFKM